MEAVERVKEEHCDQVSQWRFGATAWLCLFNRKKTRSLARKCASQWPGTEQRAETKYCQFYRDHHPDIYAAFSEAINF